MFDGEIPVIGMPSQEGILSFQVKEFKERAKQIHADVDKLCGFLPFTVVQDIIPFDIHRDLKPGDKIRRTGKDFENIKKDGIYIFKKYNTYSGESLFLEGNNTPLMVEYFERVVEPVTNTWFESVNVKAFDMKKDLLPGDKIRRTGGNGPSVKTGGIYTFNGYCDKDYNNIFIKESHNPNGEFHLNKFKFVERPLKPFDITKDLLPGDKLRRKEDSYHSEIKQGSIYTFKSYGDHRGSTQRIVLDGIKDASGWHLNKFEFVERPGITLNTCDSTGVTVNSCIDNFIVNTTIGPSPFAKTTPLNNAATEANLSTAIFGDKKGFVTLPNGRTMFYDDVHPSVSDYKGFKYGDIFLCGGVLSYEWNAAEWKCLGVNLCPGANDCKKHSDGLGKCVGPKGNCPHIAEALETSGNAIVDSCTTNDKENCIIVNDLIDQINDLEETLDEYKDEVKDLSCQLEDAESEILALKDKLDDIKATCK